MRSDEPEPMGRILLIALVVFGALWLTDRVGLAPGGAGTRVDGRTVWREADQIEGRFVRSAPLEATWMVFGGDAGGQRNALAHATVAGLDLRHARALAARHPDFHLCSSPGAREAQGLTEVYSLVASTGAVRDAAREAVRQHDERIRRGGERTCLRVRGAHLDLQGARVAADGRDISSEVVPAFRQVRFVLAEEAEVADCGPLLR
jgi:hypothetical protein